VPHGCNRLHRQLTSSVGSRPREGAGKPRPLSLLKHGVAVADMEYMKRLPKRTKIMGLAGAGILVLALAAKFVLLQPPGNVASPPLVIHHSSRAAKASATSAADRGLPASLRRALAHHDVVVAVLYSPGMPGDSAALATARQGASSAHAGFAALDVHSEPIARVAALKLAASNEPAVVVVRRPNTVELVLPGNADAGVVAQAVAQAHP
jgi:hypothetical protein